MKTNLIKTHDIDSAYKEFDFTDIAKKYQDDGTKYCFDALEGRIVTGQHQLNKWLDGLNCHSIVSKTTRKSKA